MTNSLTHSTEIINHITQHPDSIESTLALVESIFTTEGYRYNDILELLEEVLHHFQSYDTTSIESTTIYNYLHTQHDYNW